MSEFNNVDINKFKNNRLLSYDKSTHFKAILETLVNFFINEKFISS
jgi:hypothetical protein